MNPELQAIESVIIAHIRETYQELHPGADVDAFVEAFLAKLGQTASAQDAASQVSA